MFTPLPWWRWLCILAVFFGGHMVFFSQILHWLFLRVWPAYRLYSLALQASLLSVISTIITALILFWLSLPLWKNEVQNSKRNWLEVIQWVLISFGLYFVGTVLLSLITARATGNNNQSLITVYFAVNPLGMTFCATLIGPFCEEIVFRAALGSQFFKNHPLFGILTSSILFALMHIYTIFFTGQWGQLVNFLPYFYTGFLLVVLYKQTGTLTASLILHMLINILAVSNMIGWF
ncbi:MAG: CPBP family intramembrane metalloprotease [Erysipelotrichaceae bacterium]|nr:CPBP family intramembrane metalloprotease [Erysipelotrichaceae bacterium]